MYYVYKIINKINGKLYIGQTNNLESRWLKHCSMSRVINYNHPLYNSIRKYGLDNFMYEIIDQFDNLDECNKSEELWIQNLRTQDRNFGYNIAFGGNNKTTSQETKDKLSKLNSGEGNPFYGKTHSEETKQKLSEMRVDSIITDEIRSKMSVSKIGKKNPMFNKHHTTKSRDKMSQIKIGKYDGENNPFYGKTHSEETKQKLSEINTGKTLSEETKQKISTSLIGKMSGENNPMYGKIGADNPMFGKTHSDEVKLKLSNIRKGRPLSEETKRKMSEARKGKPSNRWKNRSKEIVTRQTDIDQSCGIE